MGDFTAVALVHVFDSLVQGLTGNRMCLEILQVEVMHTTSIGRFQPHTRGLVSRLHTIAFSRGGIWTAIIFKPSNTPLGNMQIRQS